MFFCGAEPCGGHVPQVGTVAHLRDVGSVSKEEAIYKFARCDLSLISPETCVVLATLGQYTLAQWGHQSSTSRECPGSTSGDSQAPGHALLVLQAPLLQGLTSSVLENLM